MGRARDLAATAAGGTLIPRIDALESGQSTLTTALGVTNSNVAALASALGTSNINIATLKSRVDAMNGMAKLFTSTTEQYSVVPVNGSLLSLYSITIPDMVAGDIMLLAGQFELTNDLGYNVGISRYLLRTTAALSVSGTPVAPAVAAQDNVDPIRHHAVVNQMGMEVCPTNNGVVYNLVVGAVSSSGSGNLSVELGYGRLIGVRIRNPPLV